MIIFTQLEFENTILFVTIVAVAKCKKLAQFYVNNSNASHY